MGAGKGTCAEYLVRRGFKHCVIRDYLLELVSKQGLEPTRPNMLKVANELRNQHGPAVLVERLCADARNSGGRFIIDSVRTIAEAEMLHKAGGVLLAVDADKETRYSRICSRGSETDSVSFKQFCDDEAREEHSQDSCRPSVRTVMKMTQYCVQNDRHLKELHSSLDGIFGQTAWVCIVGPHGTGKTVLLKKVSERLSKLGIVLNVCEELARPLIHEMCLKQDDFTHVTDRFVEFQRRLLDRYVARHSAAMGQALLSDRSVLDELAYIDWQVSRGRLEQGVLVNEWDRAVAVAGCKLQDFYSGAHFFLLRPEASLCEDDGTRMQSGMQDLWDLHLAFERVLQRAGMRFQHFSAIHSDPEDIVQLFVPS